jgi:uncharacterized membrane protein
LRAAALIANVAGAVGSLGLWIHAARHPPPLIIALFVVWVLSPFVILGAGHILARRWLPGTQSALYWVTLFVALAALVIYTDDAIAHRAAHPAFVYTAVPPILWAITGAAIAIGAARARKRVAGRLQEFE